MSTERIERIVKESLMYRGYAEPEANMFILSLKRKKHTPVRNKKLVCIKK